MVSLEQDEEVSKDHERMSLLSFSRLPEAGGKGLRIALPIKAIRLRLENLARADCSARTVTQRKIAYTQAWGKRLL